MAGVLELLPDNVLAKIFSHLSNRERMGLVGRLGDQHAEAILVAASVPRGALRIVCRETMYGHKNPCQVNALRGAAHLRDIFLAGRGVITSLTMEEEESHDGAPASECLERSVAAAACRRRVVE